MDYYPYIIRLLVLGNSLLTVGQCCDDKNDKETFKFEVELMSSMWTAKDETRINRTGWTLRLDPETLKKVCVAAANFISFELKNLSKAPSAFWTDWGSPAYPHRDSYDAKKHINYLYCGASPRDFYVRATGPPSERSYIIMVTDVRPSSDGFYGLSPREYVFDVKIMETDPMQSTNDNLEKDLLSVIENVDLRNVYQEMKFLDMMLVCLLARDYVSHHFSVLKSEMAPSPIGLHPLKMYNYKRGQFEEHVGYRCPVQPLLYVYFEDSKSVGVVVVVQPDH